MHELGVHSAASAGVLLAISANAVTASLATSAGCEQHWAARKAVLLLGQSVAVVAAGRYA